MAVSSRRVAPALIFAALLAPVLACTVAWCADPWPGPLPGTSIAANLPGAYEPSGAVWHPRLGKLFTISDSGIVSAMDEDGNNVVNWYVGGDLEGITYADSNSDILYLGVENPDGVQEFNFVTGQILRTFDLRPWLDLGGTTPANSGLEALTFVSDPGDPEGGLFYAGLQYDGKIYEFSLPIKSSPSSTAVTYVGTITPVAGRSDLSDMDWDAPRGLIYAIYDSSNFLRVMQPDGTFVAEYYLPGIDQEGIAVRDCDLFIAEDTGNLLRYDFPVDGTDDDDDGIPNCFDTCSQACCIVLSLTSWLPDGDVGYPYDETIVATGTSDPKTFTLTTGSLPTGLDLSSDGRISGTPTADGFFTFVVTATDSGGCAGSQAYTVEIVPAPTGTCIFRDHFNDGNLDPSWTYTGGMRWLERGGALVGLAKDQAMRAVADPEVASCTVCTVSGTIMVGPSGRAWLIGWRSDASNDVELRFLEHKNRIVLAQRVAGVVQAKETVPFKIRPDVAYRTSVSFDGATFTVTVNGSAVLTMPKWGDSTPSGTAGFGIRRSVGRLGQIEVCESSPTRSRRPRSTLQRR